MTYLGASAREWRQTALCGAQVVAARLALISRCDAAAQAELQRALVEKLDFCTRWSWRMAVTGWMDPAACLAELAGDMRDEIARNRDRLAG